MELRVRVGGDGPRLDGGPIADLVNRYLAHLRARGFAAGTTRGYAFDLLNFSRFLVEQDLAVTAVTSGDLFDWLDWQSKAAPSHRTTVVALRSRRGPAPSTINRRVAAVRGLRLARTVPPPSGKDRVGGGGDEAQQRAEQVTRALSEEGQQPGEDRVGEVARETGRAEAEHGKDGGVAHLSGSGSGQPLQDLESDVVRELLPAPGESGGDTKAARWRRPFARGADW